ncbi:MAG: IclR family transcriptional regulator [Solirubrobacteraceae bacterium]
MSHGQTDPAERAERLRRGKTATGREYTPNILDVPDPRHSRSLEYSLAMAQCFSGEWATLGIADLADMLGLSRSTTHRYALTLVAEGWLEQDSRRKYRLAGGAADVGMSIVKLIAWRAESWPVLEELREQTGHTASFGILDGVHATYLQRAHSHGHSQHEADGSFGPGAHVPLYCTALGKAMLARQDEHRQRELVAEMKLTRHGPNTIRTKRALLAALARGKAAGIAISDEEHAAGVRSIAVAINRRSRKQTFAVEVTVPAELYTPTELRQNIGPSVREAAGTISTYLRGG